MFYLQYLKKVQTKPVSPFQGSPDEDRGSPNKSPSQQSLVKSSQASNVNPNASTFVPTGMQGGSELEILTLKIIKSLFIINSLVTGPYVHSPINNHQFHIRKSTSYLKYILTMPMGSSILGNILPLPPSN